MSKPSEGTYVIVNRILSPIGDQLAITFNAEGKATTLTPRSNSEAQRVCFFFAFVMPGLPNWFSGYSRITMLKLCPLPLSNQAASRQRGVMDLWPFFLLTIMFGPSRAAIPDIRTPLSIVCNSGQYWHKPVYVASKTVVRLCTGELQKRLPINTSPSELAVVTKSRGGFSRRADDSRKLDFLTQSHRKRWCTILPICALPHLYILEPSTRETTPKPPNI